MKKKKNTAKLTACVLTLAMLAACSEAPPNDISAADESKAETTVTAASTTAAEPDSAPDEAVTGEEDTHELYDTKPISDAYLSGDSSGLNELQLEILARAQEVIDEVITDDMDDYHKELAIHDYIINNVTYDENMLSVFETPSENSDNPYGALVLHQSICSGYTTTFQMFMDMLEIPCISIHASDYHDEEHAWNMVQINGKWYHTDVTWDDPVPDKHSGIVLHDFFNVTDEVMLEEHRWDRTLTPAAESFDDTYAAHELKTLESWDDFDAIIDEALAQKTLTVFIEPDEALGCKLDGELPDAGFSNGSEICEELGKIYNRYARTRRDVLLLFRRDRFEDRQVIHVYISIRQI